MNIYIFVYNNIHKCSYAVFLLNDFFFSVALEEKKNQNTENNWLQCVNKRKACFLWSQKDEAVK